MRWNGGKQIQMWCKTHWKRGLNSKKMYCWKLLYDLTLQLYFSDPYEVKYSVYFKKMSYASTQISSLHSSSSQLSDSNQQIWYVGFNCRNLNLNVAGICQFCWWRQWKWSYIPMWLEKKSKLSRRLVSWCLIWNRFETLSTIRRRRFSAVMVFCNRKCWHHQNTNNKLLIVLCWIRWKIIAFFSSF